MRCCFCSLEIFNLVKGHLEAVISRRTNKIPDPHEYSCAECRHRYLPVHVLLDISESTKDMRVGSDNTVLELERRETVLLTTSFPWQRRPSQRPTDGEP
jgi:hypothetical protein